MLISLSYKTKDYCIQLVKAQGEQIGWKAPPPLFCLFVRYSAWNVWCDVTLPNHTSCIIEHPIGELAEKPPPPRPNRENFLHWIYPFHAISSNFQFCGRTPPRSSRAGKFFFTLDLSISGNFQQLWFLWQKSPSPPSPSGQPGKIFFTLDLSISCNFQQLWILWQKSPPPPPPQQPNREILFTLDLSISCSF